MSDMVVVAVVDKENMMAATTMHSNENETDPRDDNSNNEESLVQQTKEKKNAAEAMESLHSSQDDTEEKEAKSDSETKVKDSQQDTPKVESTTCEPEEEEEEASTPKKKRINDNLAAEKESSTTVDGDDDDAAAAVVAPHRPVKRARTAYFIFADEKRPDLQQKHAGEGVAVVAKALGLLWANLTDEEKQVYHVQAAAERERVARDLQAWIAAGGVASLPDASKSGGGNTRSKSDALDFPIARIRKICKLDPEVRGLSKEALCLVTKAAELMTAKLGAEAVRVAQIQNRRKLLPDDVAQVCQSREQFMFLREDIQDLVRVQHHEATAAAHKNTSTSSSSHHSKAAANPKSSDYAAAKGTKPLTAFFSAKSKGS